jgi:hypothetical protein
MKIVRRNLARRYYALHSFGVGSQTRQWPAPADRDSDPTRALGYGTGVGGGQQTSPSGDGEAVLARSGESGGTQGPVGRESEPRA